MNAQVYHACFECIAKEAGLATGVARVAERVGRPIMRYGRDVGKLSLDTFRPAAIAEGARDLVRGGATWGNVANVGLTVGLGVPAAMGTLRQKTDPQTGVPMGIAERSLLAGSRITSGLVGMTAMKNMGLMRGMGVGMGAMAVTDPAARVAGRLVDAGVRKVFHPAVAAGGSPVAAGVR